LDEEEKKGFSSLACMLVGDYMRVCENKQKDECWRVLSTTRHIEKENVCRFEIGRDKKYCSQCVACRNRREREEEEEEISSIHCDVVLEKKFSVFFSTIKRSLLYKKKRLLNEGKIIINA